MTAQRRMSLLSLQLAWMIASIVALSMLDAFTYELFFVLSVLGFLIVADVTRPIVVTPDWWDRLRLLLEIGLLGFVFVTARRLSDLLGTGTPF